MEEHNTPPAAAVGPLVPPRPLAAVEYLADVEYPALVEYRAASRRRMARLVGLGLVLFAVALAVFAMIGRDGIVAMWPSSAGFYRAFWLSPAIDAGLSLGVTAARDGGALVVRGDILNRAGETRRVPRLRLALRDGRGNELEVKIVEPPVARLPPGAAAHFETVFEHPSLTAAGAAASFASEP